MEAWYPPGELADLQRQTEQLEAAYLKLRAALLS
jgi:hypothetical protein